MIDRIAARLGHRVASVVRKYPRRLYAAIVLGCAGFGVTAFGVSPLASVDSQAQRLITESVLSADLPSQVSSMAQQELSLIRNGTTRPGDTVDSLLRRMGVDDAEASAFLRRDYLARELLSGRSGKMIQVSADVSGQLDELVARYPVSSTTQFGTHFTRLRVVREGSQFTARIEIAPLTAMSKMGSGTVVNSLFNATDDAGLPDTIATQLAEVFATEINFHRDLRRGDTFSVVYETLTADGEPITWNGGAPDGHRDDFWQGVR